jgi:two-component system sensor histidine kinase RegB
MMSEHASRHAPWYFEVTPEAIARGLTRLWWTAAAVDAGVVVLSIVLPSADFPLRRVAPLIAAGALANAELAAHVVDGRPRYRLVAAGTLLLHIVLLTALLELSGGPSNPFSVIYAVQVALAAATLGRAWAWTSAAAAVACYSVLITWHMEETVPAHHRFVDFPTHLYAMWLTIGTLAELAIHFAGAASRAIARREAQLDDLRVQHARAERLMSLTTLAAGAAHELSTPLATIAVASKELERALADLPVPDDCRSDAHLIRTEVDRCRLILDQMSGRAGGSAAEAAEPVALDTLLTDVKARLPEDLCDRLDIRLANPHASIVAPRAGLVQVLLSLLRNAFDASGDLTPVCLEVEQRRDMCRFVVEDRGTGMSADTLRRAGEPFFTTKAAGRGFGLGLFLARVFAERCGGSLALESGRGTRATLTLPMNPHQGEA